MPAYFATGWSNADRHRQCRKLDGVFHEIALAVLSHQASRRPYQFFNPLSMRLLAERTGFTLQSLETSNVRFYEEGDVPPPVYRLAKITSELLNIPAKLLGKGHDLLSILRPR